VSAGSIWQLPQPVVRRSKCASTVAASLAVATQWFAVRNHGVPVASASLSNVPVHAAPPPSSWTKEYIATAFAAAASAGSPASAHVASCVQSGTGVPQKSRSSGSGPNRYSLRSSRNALSRGPTCSNAAIVKRLAASATASGARNCTRTASPNTLPDQIRPAVPASSGYGPTACPASL